MRDHKAPKWRKSEQFDEYQPVCRKCEETYPDGQIFDVKNYPDDGGATLFLKCEKCGYEAQLNFEWKPFVPEVFG